MERSNPKFNLGLIIMLGSVWGLSEAGLGMALQSCASRISGSLMTGVALFFISASWAVSRRLTAVVIVVLVACVFKVFDALLLSLPIGHGAVANPMFAFMLEGMAFMLLLAFFSRLLAQKMSGRALLGGSSAFIAVGLFPLVKFATGNPACLYPGTSIPLSIYFAPLAVIISAITVPGAFQVAEMLATLLTDAAQNSRILRVQYILSPATVVLCMAFIALIRLI